MLPKRILSLFLTAALLLGALCGSFSVQAADGFSSDTGAAEISVLYIPLDNRPFNYSEVCTYARSIGISLIMPDEALFATTLDGQTSETGLQSGDRAALVEWLLEHAAQADILVLSLDQLLSGGLMNSRTLEDTGALTLSDGTVMDEYGIIDLVASLAADHEIYLLDSVLRLASDYGYGGYTLEDYNITRAYGRVARKELTGAALTPENIIAGYRYAADGSDALGQAGLSASQRQYFLADADTGAADASGAEAAHSRLQRYLNIRQRKLSLNAYAIEKLSGLENTHYYLGVDDSSSGGNLQTNEISCLLQLSGGNVSLINTLDGITQQLLTQIRADALQTAMPTARVLWYGSSADSSLSYSRITIRQDIENTAAALGMELRDDSADLCILALTASSTTAAADAAVCRLAAQLNENEAAGITTLLILYTTLTAGQKQLLAGTCHLGFLLSAAGNYQPSNATMGLSMGLGRYLMLASGAGADPQLAQAHIENLAESFLYICFDGSSQKSEMRSMVSGLGLDYTNFGDLSADTRASISASLTEAAAEAAADTLTSIAGSSYIVSLQPYQTGSISEVELVSAVYPWNRTFEVEYTLQAQLHSGEGTSGTLHSQFVRGTSDTAFSPEAPATREQLVTLLVRVSGVTLSTAADYRFRDVSAYAAAAVQTGYENGWIHGYEDGTFRGSRAMTRAEFCTLLARYMDSAGRTLTPVRESAFRDVPETGTWYSSNVYRLARAGYISGYPDGTFRPNQTITRAEAVTLLCRLFGRTEALSEGMCAVPRFSDVSAKHWAFRYIQEASISHFCTD